jgi:hypothetical protein
VKEGTRREGQLELEVTLPAAPPPLLLQSPPQRETRRRKGVLVTVADMVALAATSAGSLSFNSCGGGGCPRVSWWATGAEGGRA